MIAAWLKSLESASGADDPESSLTHMVRAAVEEDAKFTRTILDKVDSCKGWVNINVLFYFNTMWFLSRISTFIVSPSR